MCDRNPFLMVLFFYYIFLLFIFYFTLQVSLKTQFYCSSCIIRVLCVIPILIQTILRHKRCSLYKTDTYDHQAGETLLTTFCHGTLFVRSSHHTIGKNDIELQLNCTYKLKCIIIIFFVCPYLLYEIGTVIISEQQANLNVVTFFNSRVRIDT